MEVSQIGAMAEEGAPIQVVEPGNREEAMFMSGKEVSMAPVAEVMEIELPGIVGDQMKSSSWESQVAHLEMGEQPEAPIEPPENAGAGQIECETLEKVVAAVELPPTRATSESLIVVEAMQEGEEDSQERVEVHASKITSVTCSIVGHGIHY